MNILITGAWQQAKEYIAEIEAMGHKVFFLQYEKDELPCKYDEVEGVICNGLFLHHPIERFTKLIYIQLTSAGYDRVPMDYVSAHNIVINNAKGVYSVPMAEFALCGVLQLYKQSRFFYENQKAHKWEKHRGLMELSGKTVCIVGCGSVGTECAKRFSTFACKVIGVDIVTRQDDNFCEMVELGELDDALKVSDVVALTLPLTDDTYHLIDADRLACMKPTVILVNIARGAVVDTKALADSLINKGIYGAVLDVFEDEPLREDSSLWDMDNVILTPHVSFIGDGNDCRLTDLIMKKLTYL